MPNPILVSLMFKNNNNNNNYDIKPRDIINNIYNKLKFLLKN
jgi:hypothetical protein